MSSPSSVSIGNNLSSSQTGITSWSTDDESSTRIENEFSILKPSGWDSLSNDKSLKISSDAFVRDMVIMLAGDQNGIDSQWSNQVTVLFVFNGDLDLGVGSDP